MKIAITGMPQSGQQPLFSLIANLPLEAILQKPLEVQVGTCDVRDPRVTAFSRMYKPKKTTYAKIEYSLLPDFAAQGPVKNLIFNQLKNSDEICWVARAENARGDVSHFVSEMAMADFMLVEKRLETIAKDQRGKFSEQREKEKLLMEECKKQLESGRPLREAAFSEDQKKVLRAYQFYTLKPIFIVINVPENKLRDTSLLKEMGTFIPYPCLQLSVEIEQEISRLGEEEREEYLRAVGIDEPAIDKMNRAAYAGLGLISFFTVGEDEVRAWPLRRGAAAAEAGAVIHSDIEKGFVRAEMMKGDELLAAGAESKLKETGKFHLKGRDYLIEDGDILSFRFNV